MFKTTMPGIFNSVSINEIKEEGILQNKKAPHKNAKA
jgi:hypothetical protein